MEQLERPKGPTDLDCPFHQKAMSKVCHKCPMWTMVERTHKDGEKQYQEKQWSCAFAWLAPISIELLQETTSASTEMNKLRNLVSNVGTGLMQLARRGQDMKRLENGKE